MSSPEKLDMQTVGYQRNWPVELLTSLLRVRRGWFGNHALQRTGPSLCVRRLWFIVSPPCAHASWPGQSLSLGR